LSAEHRPQVGVGVLVIRAGSVLLGKRRGAHGAGSWAAPGGKLDFGESIEDCARRELREETGLLASTIELGPYTSDVFEDCGEHYVTIFAIARDVEGVPQCLEPEKCGGWSWHRWSDLPHPLFLPIASLVDAGYEPDPR
jgi:8-oxo-dGTP diphosphatase